MKSIHLSALILLFYCPVYAQSDGFYDDFEDSVADTFWKADHPATFGISESGGFLNITYNRTAESGIWDNFNFTPPEEIDVSGNPHILFRIKSDVANTFTVKPIYTNGNDGWLKKTIPADQTWHTYTYTLEESNYTGGNLRKIYFYFDGGSSDIKSGLVQFDHFQIAGSSIQISQLKASLVDSVTVDLFWESDDTTNSDHYNIYRSTAFDFTIGPGSKIGESTETQYRDTGLLNHTDYYYKVTATGMDGREHQPASASIRTSNPGAVPEFLTVSENSNPVGRYEKYELVIEMLDATYTNPYNPEEIDLYAWFFGPDGDSVKIFGFYDNYLERDQWKIRFAARQTGEWSYKIFATDVDGTGSSEVGTFSVEESSNNGWLHISPENPNYLMHDDSSSFYGISVYYPWSVTRERLDDFVAVDGNFFGYWDCTYDNSGNGGGKYLLESMESGVGRYDQRKAARIDEVLSWAEARDMKVMLAAWVHGFLRIDGVPWSGGHWYTQNPYSSLVEPEEFFTDSVALSYQEKHHRYMIARWGYSTSLGIWEIINEAHGTTGWVRDQSGTKKWVERVHSYFKENDPFQRPTTASFGGGSGASHFNLEDKLGDMPNIHFYEQHGWPNRYPSNLVRSGLSNVVSESRTLKDKGDRPAFFGEAGYYTMLTDSESEGYTWEFHNSFWAGLVNGLASTPFWWEFNKTDIFTSLRLQDYRNLNRFVSDIDFAHEPYAPTQLTVVNTDAYFMGAPSGGFGWMKTYADTSLSNAQVYLNGTELENGNYSLEWYNTWSGETLLSERAISVDGASWAKVPAALDELDVAFKLNMTENGSDATKVHLQWINKDTLRRGSQYWYPDADSTLQKIACYVTDDEGHMDASFAGTVEIFIEGAEQDRSFSLDLTSGGVLIDYDCPGMACSKITASVEGLESASLFLGDPNLGTGKEMQNRREKTMLQNLPNPFDRSTSIQFNLPEETMVRLDIYDMVGAHVETLINEYRSKGAHSITWNPAGERTGIYYCTMNSAGSIWTHKMMLVK